jgi:hypothetical protein
MPAAPLGVTITAADIWAELRATRADVSKTLTAVEGLQEKHKDVTRTQDDHESRIRSLERFQYKLVGAFVVVQIALGILEYFLLNHK